MQRINQCNPQVSGYTAGGGCNGAREAKLMGRPVKNTTKQPSASRSFSGGTSTTGSVVGQFPQVDASNWDLVARPRRWNGGGHEGKSMSVQGLSAPQIWYICLSQSILKTSAPLFHELEHTPHD
ncbi:hypothetical protein SCARD494_10669 [Seiridium cardinale]